MYTSKIDMICPAVNEKKKIVWIVEINGRESLLLSGFQWRIYIFYFCWTAGMKWVQVLYLIL